MKKFAAILVTGLLFASTASAQVISNPTTNARMDGLGVNNWQIEDDFNIWINPAQITNYKNGAYIELGTDDCSRDPLVSATSGNCGNATTTNTGGNDPLIGGTGVNDRSVGAFGGIHLDAPYGTWGVYIGRPYSGPLNTMDGANSGDAPTANKFDLFYGLHGMPFGFYLSYADRSDKVTPSGGSAAKDEASEINVGLGGIFGGGMLEGAVNVGLPSSKCDDTGTPGLCGSGVADNIKDDAGMNFALLLRHHAGGLLTTARIISTDASTKNVAASTKTDDTTMALSLGTALNSRPFANALVVAGIDVTSSSRESKPTGGTKTTIDSITVPVNLGMEHQTFSKLKTRLGIAKNIYNTSTCKNVNSALADPCGDSAGFGTGDKVEAVSDGSASVSVGLGWTPMENLTIDAVINQDVLFTGTYMISGIPESLNSKLSVAYRFK